MAAASYRRHEREFIFDMVPEVDTTPDSTTVDGLSGMQEPVSGPGSLRRPVVTLFNADLWTQLAAVPHEIEINKTGSAESPDTTVVPEEPDQIQTILHESQHNDVEKNCLLVMMRMTPELCFSATGLCPDETYELWIMFLAIDKMWLYFHELVGWTASPTAAREAANPTYKHPLGAMSGRQWMTGFIRCSDIRLTSNPRHAVKKFRAAVWKLLSSFNQ